MKTQQRQTPPASASPDTSIWATCLGAGVSGLGGLYYVLDYNQGIWATTTQIEALGWLAVALVIFTTWKPLNAIWGSYLFGLLYWLYQFHADAAGHLGSRLCDRPDSDGSLSGDHRRAGCHLASQKA